MRIQQIHYTISMPVKIIIDAVKKPSLLSNITTRLAVRFMENTAKPRLRMMQKYITGNKILDIGLGTGSIAKLLSDGTRTVTSIDVTNTSLYPDIQPIMYDGVKIPFKANSFDTGLLICVLHHCDEQLEVLKDSMRTCRRLVILEDTFRNPFERALVAARDSIGNFEFYHHTYRSSKEWQKIFKDTGWKMVYKKEWSNISSYGMYGRQTLFVIDKR